MRKIAITLLLFALAACSTTTTPATRPARVPVPVTEVRPVTETIQGVQITDPYRWLEDQNSPETRDWIARQNAYTDAMLSNLPDKARFAQRLEALLNTDQITMPRVRNGR